MVVCEYNNKILILKEYRIGLKKFSWGLPGGFINKNEIKLEKNVTSKWLTRSEVKLYIKKNKFETPGVITALYYYLYCLD